MSRLGPSFTKICTCRSSLRSRSEKLLEFFWRDPNYFLLQLVTMDQTWLYHDDPETKQQSMERQHSGSPYPKKFWVQKSAGKVLASIFLDQDSILLIDYLPKGQTINTECYSSLLVQLKDILEEKHRGKITKEGSCSFTTMPWLTGHLQPWRNWRTWASSVLITPSYSLDLVPLDYHLLPGLKNNWNVAIFRPTRRSLLLRRPS